MQNNCYYNYFYSKIFAAEKKNANSKYCIFKDDFKDSNARTSYRTKWVIIGLSTLIKEFTGNIS